MSDISSNASVRVVDDIAPDQIPKEVFDATEPLLLRGLIRDWPAVQRCSNEPAAACRYLAGFWSGEPVTVYVGDESIDGRFFYNDDFTGFNFRSGRAPLDQVFQRLAQTPAGDAAPAIYVGSTAIDRWLPGFRAENDLKLPVDDALASFWLGNRTRVSAHFDFPTNIACVVAGRRRFLLFPPDQIANLYVGPLDRTPSGQSISLVDPLKPDFERYPRYRAALAASLSAELEPGDALYIPSMWWHYVESLESFNLLVNYWWCTTPPAMGSPTTALMHAILALRDLPAPQRDAWKGLFDHYVFDANETVYEHIPPAGRGCLAPLDENAALRLRAELLNRLNQ